MRSAKLSTRILVSQLTILIITMVIGFLLYALGTRHQLDRQYEQRALAVAQSVAGMPGIRRALAAGGRDPHGTVNQLASQVMRSSQASYVVVINRQGFRLSHPNHWQIGHKVSEPVVALDGQSHVRVDQGSLGPSANGRAPVFGPDGTVVGEVSAGIPEQQVSSALWQEVPAIALYTALALAFGASASLLLAKRLKRTTFGLELHEIASLLQEREAMLHGVREGAITFDPDGRVTLINDEARRLIGMRASAIGETLPELLPAGRLRDVLSGVSEGHDQIVLTEEHCLLVNRMDVTLSGRTLGSVVTLRDRTEVEDLSQELVSTRGLTDALRAQQHEFSNRMHTVVGLLELGHTAEALDYLTETTGAAREFAESVNARIGNPIVAALVVAKGTVAAERAVTMLLTDDTRVPTALVDAHAVVTILGNLIDNALDAASAGPSPAHVTVRLWASGPSLRIRVSDTGPGIPPGASGAIFREGFTTKDSLRGSGRGLGLALVHRVVHRLGGRIDVTEGSGPVFTVSLPDMLIAPVSEVVS
ncbi:MAG: ATP-binding protein [Sciscionella sp.]